MGAGIILVVLLCAVNTVPAVAQEPLTLSLDDAIDIALQQSFTVQSHLEQRTASFHWYNYRKNFFKPRLDYTISTPAWRESVTPIPQTDGLPVYNSTGLMQFISDMRFTYMLPTGGNFALINQFYRENQKTVLANQNYRKIDSDQARSSLQLSFSQPIFTRNELDENLEEARLSYERTSHIFTRRQYEIIYDVTQQFYELHQAGRVAEINRESLKNSSEAYRIAKLRGEAGRIPEGDVLQTEVEYESARADLSESEARLERTRDAFMQLIGLPADSDVRINVDLDYTIIDVDPETAVQKALEHRLEIQEGLSDIAQQEIEIDRAGREREFSGAIDAYYDLTGVSTLENGSTGDLFRSAFENVTDRPANRGITLKLSYPLYDWGRGRERVQRAKANLREKELALENQKRTIVREVRDVVRSMEEARERLEIRKKNEALALRSYNISLMRFEQGGISSQALSITQERLSQAQLDYLAAFINYQLAQADLKRKTLWDFEKNVRYDVGSEFQGAK